MIEYTSVTSISFNEAKVPATESERALLNFRCFVSLKRCLVKLGIFNRVRIDSVWQQATTSYKSFLLTLLRSYHQNKSLTYFHFYDNTFNILLSKLVYIISRCDIIILSLVYQQLEHPFPCL